MQGSGRLRRMRGTGSLGLALAILGAGPAHAQVANIYSSLPQQGTARGQTLATQNGMRLALEEAGGGAGGLTLNYIPLDDSTRANPGTADARKTAQNARQVAADPLAIAYLGEFNSGGSKVSIPILNRAGILQISPSNTFVGLTSNAPGSVRGDPQRYYPTGRRTYGRILPNDTVQAAALSKLAKHGRCGSVWIVNDGSIYGAGMARSALLAARRYRLPIAGTATAPVTRRGLEGLARRIRSPCLIYGGVTNNGALPTFKVIGALRPRLRFFGSDGVAEQAFSDPRLGGIPASIGRRTILTVATVDPNAYGPPARAFLGRYRARFRTRLVDPYALYGYETMALALDSINRAAPRSFDRAAVVDAFFATRNRQSVIGTYSIKPSGDTTSRYYGAYGISRGLLFFKRRVTVP